MFGNVSHDQHPKADVILKAVQSSCKYPRKLLNIKVLQAAPSVCTPRFGGRTVYLWVKGKTRVWVDKSTAWITTSSFPSTFVNGTLLQAEMFNLNLETSESGRWIIAFEDILIMNGEPITISDIPFNHRQTHLNQMIADMKLTSDVSRDAGIYCVKPWFYTRNLVKELKSYNWIKTPEWLYILTKDGTSFFTKFYDDAVSTTQSKSKENPEHTSENGGPIRVLYRIHEDEPDQYELRIPNTEPTEDDEMRACVRTLWTSRWLSGLADGTVVKCRRVPGFENLEPYSVADS
jgi:hypothetical protein